MAIELKNLEYAVIKMYEMSHSPNLEYEYPIILATISGTETSYDNWYTFMSTQLYPAIANRVCTVSTFLNLNNLDTNLKLAGYQYWANSSLGLSTGFATVENVSTSMSGGVRYTRGVTCQSFYYDNNKVVGNFHSQYNWGDPSIVPWVIYIDENDHPYIWNFTGRTSVPIIMSANGEDPGFADVNLTTFPISIIPPDLPVYAEASQTGTMQPDTSLTITDYVFNRRSISDDDDPYEEGGYSEPGGGDGDWDSSGEGDPFTGDMTGVMTGMDTGFFTLYRPSSAELRNLAGYLWSNSFDLDIFKKLFNNPMDLFLTLNMLPVQVPAGQQKEVGFGLISTGVMMTTAADRYYTKVFGPKLIKKRFGNYMDFSPYSKFDLYLPYIGVVSIDSDDIMNHYMEIVYVIDVLSGACVAGINKWPASSGSIRPINATCIGVYSGNAATQLPITGSDYSTLLTGIFSAVSGTIAGALSGGSTGAVAGGLAAASSAVVNESKPQISKGGTTSGVHGWINKQHPCLIKSYPKQCIPALQHSEQGFPCYVGNENSPIRKEKGFVKVAEIHLQSVRATSDELAEIESLLKEGVYV